MQMESELRSAALDQIRMTSRFASHLKLCNHVIQTNLPLSPDIVISLHDKTFFRYSKESFDLTLKLKSEHIYFLLNLLSPGQRVLTQGSE